MHEAVRVLLLGTGQMGAGIGRLILEKRGLELVGAYGRRKGRAGMDVGRSIGLDRDLGIALAADLAVEIERCRPDVAIQATCSRLMDGRDEIETLIRNGVHVITIAEEMAYPAAGMPPAAAEIDRLAREHGVVVLGTGVNPGFVLDLLVIALTGVCIDIHSIVATRVNDLSPYGPSVLATQGVGLSPEAFGRGVADGTVVGHFGFPQSLHMIADAIGWTIDAIDQRREAIVSTVRRETPFVVVEPGQVAGCLHTAVAYRAGKPVITLVHPQQVHPALEGVQTGDSIELKGTPDIRLAGSPEIPGGIATIALAVNMIPRVLNAAPGLRCMAHLPVPAAMLGDARRLLRAGGPDRGSVAAGTWVEIHRLVLQAGERLARIPEDTRAVPLEMRVKGFLAAPAELGDEAEIITAAGRRVRGTLAAVNPGYAHGFGPPIPELISIGREVREVLRTVGVARRLV